MDFFGFFYNKKIHALTGRVDNDADPDREFEPWLWVVTDDFNLLVQLQVFRKDNRAMLSRKELFRNALRKAAYAVKRVIELHLSGMSQS